MKKSKKGFLATLICIFSAAGATVATAQDDVTQGAGLIEEILVTATKRSTSLNDLGASVSALGAETIEERNLTEMDDYLRTMPGVNMIKMDDGAQNIMMRGITAGPQFEAKTVGVYFGEIPTSGNVDMKMVDIERVEVLRGPHGTLYGSGTMSGAVRIIPTAVKLNEFEGSVKAELSSTAAKGGTNHKIEAVLNLPLVDDTLAARVVAFKHHDSGFIQNRAKDVKGYLDDTIGTVSKNEDQVGTTIVNGGRLSLLWDPTDDLSLLFSHILEDTDKDGRMGANPGLGDFTQARFKTLVGDEGIESKTRHSNFIIDYDLGWASLMSSSTWRDLEVWDNRNFLGDFWETIPISQDINIESDGFIQEVRLTSSLDGSFQFLAGLYYEDVNNSGSNTYYWNANPAFNFFDSTGSYGTNGGVAFFETNVKQKAFFAEVSYDITDKLTATVGGRAFNYEIDTKRGATEGFFFPVGEAIPPDIDSEESNESYKLNLTYAVNDDSLVYLQVAEGFRLGRPLPPPPTNCDANQDGIHDDLGIPFPDQIDSDFTENFEIGTKLALLDRSLQLNISAYRINWDGIPVFVGAGSPCGTGLTINGGSATSQGVEVEATYYASEHLKLEFTSAYIDAEIDTDVPGLGAQGDRLPGMPKINARLGLQYQFELAGYESYLSTDYSYVGGFYNNLPELGEEAGDYTELNVNIGMRVNNMDFNLFATNLTNNDAFGWVDQFPPNVSYLRPRTIGFGVGYKF